MPRVLMTVAYDGTAFQGWQIQANARTVQSEIESALSKICGGELVRIHGSGRTDSGVHARGQCFHFDAPRPDFTPETWMRALNGNLPFDVRILDARGVADDFHARFDVCAKEYRYFLRTHRIMLPELRHVRVLESRPLDLARMREACDLLVGTHDFTAFSAERGDGSSTDPVRTLTTLELETLPEDTLMIRAVAPGFLYKMVRQITGALLRVGRGELSLSRIEDLLSHPIRTGDTPTAPAHGLFLWRVRYPKDIT
ncbi:MAG: tRNA pseudouridine(38-40) synthase TruA [Verrucomicrobia bacterium]|nr:tRNA pseudouridine(38-40) synthase TruA [Verrucomicrobiota bacterium]MCH8514646.1 tRNA pseudouridine(38-40) synthase TruA [Kiritimatiellia bacterium]